MSKLVITDLSESKELGHKEMIEVSGGMKWDRGHTSEDVLDLRSSGETATVLGVEFYKTKDGMWLKTP